MIQTAMIEKFSLWVWGVVSIFIKASTNLGVLWKQQDGESLTWAHRLAVQLFFTAPSFMQRLGPFVWQSLFLTFSRQAWQGRSFGCAACRCFFCFVPKGNPLGAFGPWYLKNRPGVSQCNVRFQIPPRTETLLFVEPAMLRGGLGKASSCSGIFGHLHSHRWEAYRCKYASHLFRAPAGTSAC